GINRRLKKPYSPAPVAYKLLINSPNDTSQPYTTGHTKNNTAAAPTMAVADIIGASRFPLKNAKASASRTPLKRLYIWAEIIPAKIPIKTFSFSSKAGFTSSTGTSNNPETVSTEIKFVTTKKPTRPLNAAAPCLSLDNPVAIPTAKSTPKSSKIDVPAFKIKLPITFVVSPCVWLMIYIPFPARIAAAGSIAIGSISDRPRLCNAFIMFIYLQIFYFNIYSYPKIIYNILLYCLL